MEARACLQALRGAVVSFLGLGHSAGSATLTAEACAAVEALRYPQGRAAVRARVPWGIG